MAATEEYENQLPVQNTGKHIRALDANGNPILIPIEEMAKVVGGLLGINDTWPRDKGLLKADLNTIKESGIYRVQEGSVNMPTNEADNWGILLSFYTNSGGGQNSSIQMLRYSNGKYYIRSMWYGNWNNWRQIATE